MLNPPLFVSNMFTFYFLELFVYSLYGDYEQPSYVLKYIHIFFVIL